MIKFKERWHTNMIKNKHNKIARNKAVKFYILIMLLTFTSFGATIGSMHVRENASNLEDSINILFNTIHSEPNFYVRCIVGTMIFLVIIPIIIGYFIGWLIPIDMYIIVTLTILYIIKKLITFIWLMYILDKKECEERNKTRFQINRERFVKWFTKWFKPKDIPK